MKLWKNIEQNARDKMQLVNTTKNLYQKYLRVERAYQKSSFENETKAHCKLLDLENHKHFSIPKLLKHIQLELMEQRHSDQLEGMSHIYKLIEKLT